MCAWVRVCVCVCVCVYLSVCVSWNHVILDYPGAWLVGPVDMTHDIHCMRHVLWLLDMTHDLLTWLVTYWHDSWLIDITRGMTREIHCMRHDSSISDMTHDSLWHDSWLTETWLVTHEIHCMRHDSSIIDMTHDSLWHDSWLIDITRGMTHEIHSRHDSWDTLYETWLRHDSWVMLIRLIGAWIIVCACNRICACPSSFAKDTNLVALSALAKNLWQKI